jgi:hypothetical protein
LEAVFYVENVVETLLGAILFQKPNNDSGEELQENISGANQGAYENGRYSDLPQRLFLNQRSALQR